MVPPGTPAPGIVSVTLSGRRIGYRDESYNDGMGPAKDVTSPVQIGLKGANPDTPQAIRQPRPVMAWKPFDNHLKRIIFPTG
jgi:hypothetical protein